MKYSIAVVAMLALAVHPASAQNKGTAAKKVAKPPAAAPVEEKDAATLEFEKFRAMMEETNPAELFEAQGEEFWKNKRGHNNVSLAESCDLGLGVGVVKGAYVQMPRYFADAGKVMDVERRIVWCMINKQGFNEADLMKRPFASDSHTPEATSLVTYVAGQSRDMKFAVPLKDPHVKDVYEIGKEVVNYRAGPYDFSCNTCHGTDGKRIRMQNLPNISTHRGATSAVMGWPGYRMTGGVMLTQQWRMGDCFRQQRFPQPKYLSDTVTSLLTYMTANANGATYKGPGIKR
ncbi:MAG: sulfur oxidation c-type cytochrome SoxA [Rhodocyclales bacterium]|nr:sulfur oxidation c-type cytochrome SoxA [Rhodocyclales bacterium]